MASSSCSLQKLILPWIVILITFSSFSTFSGCGVFSIFITSLVLIISTILLTYAKRKDQEETVQEEEEVLSQSSTSQQQQDSPELDEVGNKPVKEAVVQISSTQQQCTTIFQEKSVQDEGVDGNGVAQIHHDFYSESESIDQSCSSDQDSSDIDWPYSGNYLGQSPECSDDSISDEESLIEIALPSGHYVGPKEEDPSKFSLQQKFQEFSTGTKILQFFAEINDMNEEENLIEIDLSMGSIKCSRFEIEAKDFVLKV